MPAPSFISGNDHNYQSETSTKTIFKTSHHRVAEVTMEVAKRYERLKSSRELSTPEIQAQIIKEVSDIIKPDQGTLELEPDTANVMIKGTVEKVTNDLAEFTIDIPKIVLSPSHDVTYGFNDFDLDNLESLNFQPVSQEILIKQLGNSKSSLLSLDGSPAKERRLENYIIRGLIDDDLVDYDEYADLLYKLAGQVVGHFKSKLSDESDVENVLIHNQGKITNFIVKQLKQHYWETPTDYQVNVTCGFTVLKPFHCTIQKGKEPLNFRSILKVKSDVKKIVFGGFSKCCYPLQKFDSVDGELRFAQILEDSDKVIRWMKPARGSFRIEYKNGNAYEPDFVVETSDAKYLCEPKRSSEMENDAVLEKQKAAVRWCQYATQHALENDGKPWHYALIPHNKIMSNSSFDGLMSEFIVKPEPP